MSYHRLTLNLCSLTLLSLFLLSAGVTEPPQAQQQPQTKQKNVQVLAGNSDAELDHIMDYFKASLGVNCNFCHVNTRETGWQYEKDDKAEKKTARKMIQMVADINKNNFNGDLEVTCYGCHAGRSKPLATPLLPMAAQPARRPQQQGRPDSLPKADEILDKYIRELGGESAIAKLTSKTMKGTVTTGDDQTFGIEIIQQAPNKYLSMVTLPQGTMVRGYDGSTPWGKNMRGESQLGERDREQLPITADFYRDIRLKEQFRSLRVGKDKIDDRDMYVLSARIDEKRFERMFFDSETGLLKRRLVIVRTPVGNVPDQVDFDDYRDVSGVRIPFKVRTAGIDPRSGTTRTFTEVTINTPVDAEKFLAPK
jgi:hypothetical protein